MNGMGLRMGNGIFPLFLLLFEWGSMTAVTKSCSVFPLAILSIRTLHTTIGQTYLSAITGLNYGLCVVWC